MARKKNARKSKKPTVAQMRKIAKNQALALMTTKKSRTQVTSMPYGLVPNDRWTVANGQAGLEDNYHGTNRWYMVKPLSIPYDASLGALATNTRENQRIYANNTRVEYELHVSKKTVECFYTRVVCGWVKSSGTMAPNAFAASHLSYFLPDYNSRLDPATDSGKTLSIFSDKLRLHTPRQIYDSNFSDDTTGRFEGFVPEFLTGVLGDVVEGAEIPNALWTPIKGSVNFNYKREFTYAENDKDSLIGAHPFIAVGVFPCGMAKEFATLLPGTWDGVNVHLGDTITVQDDQGHNVDISGSSLTNPSPRLDVTCDTYFKDVM